MMWVSKRRWENLCARVSTLEKNVREQEQITDMKLQKMAKRILRQPEELSKEIEDDENIKEFVKKFIND